MNRRDALKQTTFILGYAISGATIAGLMNGCKADTTIDWQGAFFSPKQVHTISEIAETILPKTDTPGAKDVMVERFVDVMVKEHYSAADQQDFLKGLEAFEADCQQTFGKAFSDCTSEERGQLLTKYEQQSGKTQPSIWGNAVGKATTVPFYRKLKALTLLGYFTSETVGKHLLHYDPIPGKFIGCVPLAKGTKISAL